MTETVLFNVGGKEYEVARSLLNDHPETMLARMVSEEWNPNTSKKLFIERDGERFRYVLDYLRDNMAMLPIDVSKEALLVDMEFYGISASEENISVLDTRESLRSLLGVVGKTRSYFEKEIAETHKRWIILKFANLCFEDYVTESNKYIAGNEVQLEFDIEEYPVYDYQNDELLKNLLSKIGLELSKIAKYINGRTKAILKKIKN